MIRKIGAKFSRKLPSWHSLNFWMPVVLAASIFALAVLQPIPAPNHIHSYAQKTADRQRSTRQVASSTNVAQPAPVVPKTPAAPPSTPPPAPVKRPVQAGTPKPEPVVTPSPSSSVSGLAPTAPAQSPAGPQAPGAHIATGYTSTNWSGYLATNASFTSVSGAWAATTATGNGFTTSADSTWIGIGGVTTSDLIQVGTQNIIAANGQVSASAFYELLPNVSQPVPGVTVSPGDSMTATISEAGSGQWTISITDKTDGQTSTFTVAYASSLSSAEWIEEDPSFSFRRQIPFDNFHEAAFTNGLTVANGVTVTIASSTAQPVVMVNNVGQTIALPSAIGGDGASFTVIP